MFKERRRAPRAPGEGVKVKIYAEDRKPYLEEGLLCDISTRGLCFSSSNIFNFEEKLILEFILWQKYKFLILGKVIRVKKEDGFYYYGFEFIHIEPIEEIRLRKYVHTSLGKKIKYIL
jgi:c-di-GMP-binding flagellar brake protein YcgR